VRIGSFSAKKSEESATANNDAALSNLAELEKQIDAAADVLAKDEWYDNVGRRLQLLIFVLNNFWFAGCPLKNIGEIVQHYQNNLSLCLVQQEKYELLIVLFLSVDVFFVLYLFNITTFLLI
jgi:hypothetical protein